MYTTLIEPEELAAALVRNASAGSDWAVLDCRFDLLRPQWGGEAYAASQNSARPGRARTNGRIAATPARSSGCCRNIPWL